MKRLITSKEFVLLVLSLLAGIVALSDEVEEMFEMHPAEIVLGTGSLYLFVFQFLYFVIFARIVIQVTVCWIPANKISLKQFVSSMGILVLFCVIVLTLVSPWIHQVNIEIVNINQPFIEQHLHKYHQLYYYHEPYHAWMSDLFIVWLTIFILSRFYLLVLRKNEIEQNYERLKNEMLQSRIDALNHQINPHFFFNALNSLHGLIVEDEKQKSLDYLTNLSNVFRYILHSGKIKMVTLQEELDFLETYHFMLSMKYEKNLVFDIQLENSFKLLSIPSLSLLPLIENVIKHNEISSRRPMQINITTDNGYLYIRNPKHPKLDIVEKTGIGLKNLNSRFMLITGKGISIENRLEYFQVSLPLIDMNI